VVDHLAALDHNSQNIQTMIPMQVLLDIDNAKNPMLLTKDSLERAATENQFMNGKIAAIEVSPLISGIHFTRLHHSSPTGPILTKPSFRISQNSHLIC
jgi:mediator of RNA polymerase II transcription subunit 10